MRLAGNVTAGVVGISALGLAFAVSTQDDVAAAGKLVFEETAGGVGCASCHGMDAKGDHGPDIRGRKVEDILGALDEVEDMDFLDLPKAEIEAVAAYLATLI